MSTLTVPVPTGQFRRRSLSGDRDFNFKRKKIPDSLKHLSVLSKLISRLHLCKAVLVLLGSLMVFLYFYVCLNFTFRQRITRNDDNEPDLDVCSMTAKSAKIFNDLKQTITTGSLGALSHHRSNDRAWREHLLQSFDLNENLKNPFENVTYSTEGDMLEILQKHKDGKTSDKDPDIINNYPFSFILTPSEQCGEMLNPEQNVYLLFIIKSSLSHIKLRNAIRNTWANSTFTNGYTIKRAFLLGQSNDNEAVESALKSEAALYGDILQMDFIESHRNSTWKSRGGLKWASENCSGAKYVMLVDDNQYVATDMVIQLLEFMGKLDNLCMGWVNWRPVPFRSKVYVFVVLENVSLEGRLNYKGNPALDRFDYIKTVAAGSSLTYCYNNENIRCFRS
ncbi:Beta-1,3-galactosyltransferase 2 [Mizuhopecten yessoensis]|uniref:Hexosyltransferase n=1 Tax=Mizuhopecten yessoensis TaxID=6573 RepID=A0A210QL68_MIZYE|nr:Beta-1,3-galactosyltransferase 2 [Mizuhopecten yessoensis]